jgi:hypothetical protein
MREAKRDNINDHGQNSYRKVPSRVPWTAMNLWDLLFWKWELWCPSAEDLSWETRFDAEVRVLYQHLLEPRKGWLALRHWLNPGSGALQPQWMLRMILH